MAAQLAGENAIQSAQHLGRLAGAGSDGLHRNLKHGRDQRSRNAVSGDIRNQEADPVRVYLDKFVIIAADGSHGKIPYGNSQVLNNGKTGRKNRGLYLPGNLQFALDRKQAPFVCEDLLPGYVGKGEKQECEHRFVEQG